jgi:hypothetical protein
MSSSQVGRDQDEVDREIIIVENEPGDQTKRLRLGDTHHDQSGLGVDIIP